MAETERTSGWKQVRAAIAGGLLVSVSFALVIAIFAHRHFLEDVGGIQNAIAVAVIIGTGGGIYGHKSTPKRPFVGGAVAAAIATFVLIAGIAVLRS